MEGFFYCCSWDGRCSWKYMYSRKSYWLNTLWDHSRKCLHIQRIKRQGKEDPLLSFLCGLSSFCEFSLSITKKESLPWNEMSGEANIMEKPMGGKTIQSYHMFWKYWVWELSVLVSVQLIFYEVETLKNYESIARDNTIQHKNVKFNYEKTWFFSFKVKEIYKSW